MKRTATLLSAVTVLVWTVIGWAPPALADNCGSPADCFGVAGSFGTAANGLLALVALSLLLDFLPVVGTGKGIVESLTGRDVITGQELSWWERLLGVVPFVGGLAAVAGLSRAAGTASDVGRSSERVDDIMEGARGAKRAGDAVDDAGDVQRAGDAARTARDVPTINGRRPVNSKYAGQRYNGPGWTPDVAAKYPAGVHFTNQGFPDFSPYARASYRAGDLTGGYAADAAAANRALGLPRTPNGYVWHHVEDGETMILIPQDLHQAVRHSGGASIIKNGGFD